MRVLETVPLGHCHCLLFWDRSLGKCTNRPAFGQRLSTPRYLPWHGKKSQTSLPGSWKRQSSACGVYV